MLQRHARLQYVLLALVAALALTHVYLGAINIYQNLAYGHLRARQPFYESYFGPFTAHTSPEGLAAGLRDGDTVLSINGRPYTGTSVLIREVRRSRSGQPLAITYRRGSAPAVTTNVTLHAERDVPAPLVIWGIAGLFFLIALLCLLVGLYAVFARPRSVFAWLILGILAYFDPLFINAGQLYSSLRLVAQVWSDLAATAMPICLMLFGIYFPDRSSIDIRFPWIKWVIAFPILLFAPTDLLYIYGHGYNFAADAWFSPWYYRVTVVENVFGALAISYFFVNLWPKLSRSTGDARRRLRILYYGSAIGLTPFFVLAVVALARKTDIGQDINRWVLVAVLGTLLLFPLSLAYVVVVQRAMDLKILIRQGTKYAFAQRSVVIVQVLLGIWLGFAMVNFFRAGHGNHRTIDVVKIFLIMALVFAFRFIFSKRLQQWIDQHFFREAYSTEQILSELSEEARNFTEVTPLLNTITQRIGETLHIDRIAVFLRSGDSYRLQLATGIPVPPMMSPALGTFSLAATSATIATLTNGRAPATVYRDDPSSWLVDAPEAERATLDNLSTELLVPLPGRNRLAGLMALGPKRSEEPYSRTDRQLLQSVATQTGLALENAELFENLSAEIAQRERVSREIEIAREVQERLFPQVYPQVASVDLAGYCRPAQAVGGDYYDFFLLPNGSSDYQGERLALALGDISGKGISAALLMASLRASLRSAAQLQPGDLTTLMRHVNRLVYESSTANRYATFFYAEYDPNTRILTYVNAGHNPPIILRSHERLQLEATGTVIGLLPDVCYTRANVVLRPGDILIAFTDGISEAMNSAEEEWGEDSMVAAARTLAGQPACTAEQLLNCIFAAADRFTAGAPQHDDMTLLISIIR